jgi:hypothetical protein
MNQQAAVHNPDTDANKEVQVFVNNKPVVVPHETTGREIKSLAGVPSDFQLFRVHGNQEDPIGDEEKIEAHQGERFIASPTLDPS